MDRILIDRVTNGKVTAEMVLHTHKDKWCIYVNDPNDEERYLSRIDIVFAETGDLEYHSRDEGNETGTLALAEELESNDDTDS